MKIGIVLHPYDEEKPTGLGRFIYELTENLMLAGKENEFLLFSKHKPRTEARFAGVNWKFFGGDGGTLWLDTVLKRNPKADIYIFNTPIMPIFFRPKKSVVIALDFAYIHLPSHSPKRWIQNKLLFYYHKISLRKADHIVATSYTTKGDVIKLFDVPERKVTVIYPGFVHVSDLREKRVEVPSNYFYYVGAIKERKNVLNMVKAFVLFKEKTNNDYKFVIAGNNSGEYYEQVLSFIKEKNRENDIIFLGYISDEESSYLYKHAKAFIFTTLIEGAMGMPVLEAMDSSTPVITSNTPTFTELHAEDSALTADPLNIGDIAEKMQAIISDSMLRESLILNGKELVKKFNWESIAEEYLQLIRSFRV